MIWILEGVPGVPFTLFALDLNSFRDATAAITEYQELQEDYEDLDQAFDAQTLNLDEANHSIRAANANIVQLQSRIRTQRGAIYVLGGLTAGAAITATVLAILLSRKGS